MSNYERYMGEAVSTMIEHAERYETAYKNEFGDAIGTDYVLGVAFKDVLTGLRALLNGPLGRHDGGTLDRAILRIAEHADLLDKNGEL